LSIVAIPAILYNLSPGSKKVNLLNIYTGSMSENVLAVIMVIATITVIANNYLNIV
jgi:hypothetical protein